MNKHFLRIVSLVLIPCVLADPVSAAALSPQSLFGKQHVQNLAYISALNDQALSQPSVVFSVLRRFIAPDRRITTLWSLLRSSNYELATTETKGAVWTLFNAAPFALVMTASAGYLFERISYGAFVCLLSAAAVWSYFLIFNEPLAK